MVTSRLDTWEPGSALEAIALWHRARMEGNKIKLSQTCSNLVKLDQTCSFAHLATRFLLEVRDRHSEFSGWCTFSNVTTITIIMIIITITFTVTILSLIKARGSSSILCLMPTNSNLF